MHSKQFIAVHRGCGPTTRSTDAQASGRVTGSAASTGERTPALAVRLVRLRPLAFSPQF